MPANTHYRDGTIPKQRDPFQQLNNAYNIHERRLNYNNYYPKYSPENRFKKSTSPRQYGKHFSSDNPPSSYASYESPHSNTSVFHQTFPDSYDYRVPGQSIQQYKNTAATCNSAYQSGPIEPAKHKFTGWAGKWPTTLKVAPKVSDEEDLPVYTKPSVRKKSYSSDFISK